ncbi:MAG: bifunctional pyr operon transcriptional regulator/uracil phosphoribosyltransferase PyrR [Leptospirales bacterium]
MSLWESPRLLLDPPRIDRILRRMAHEILEKNQGPSGLYLVGILKGGEPLAEKLAQLIEDFEGTHPPVGALDVTLYRDDLSGREGLPLLRQSHLPLPIDGKKIVLVDDVLFTGRTVRAAMDFLVDFGRPSRIMLAVLVDRGHRELPIRADFVGKNLPTSHEEKVLVDLSEGAENVTVVRPLSGEDHA